MAGTRSSARQAAKATSSPASSQNKPSPNAGSKRKASPSAAQKPKRGKNSDEKEQSTIEASMPKAADNGESKDIEMKDEVDSSKPGQGADSKESNLENGVDAQHEKSAGDKKDEPSNAENASVETNGKTKEGTEAKQNGFDKIMDHSGDKEPKNATEEGTGSKVAAADNAVGESAKREEATPSSILEKGIIYFFLRGRVGIDEPSSVSDIARSYIVLRPLPHGAKLGEGPIGDAGNNRILALPKKVLPKSPKDRFMTFVERANTSMDDVKERLSSSDYTTKTAGARHTPAAAPIGEGVYAITQTGRDTHLAYILTIPSELREIQRDVGLKQRGSYFTSAKNPQSSGPANASLPQGAEYPQEIIDEFRGRGWMPLQPRLLDYENTQFLLIGHGDNALETSTKPQDGEDEKPQKETPLEEVEKLEHEDEMRVEHLNGDDSVFTDLGLSSREYPKVQTTW